MSCSARERASRKRSSASLRMCSPTRQPRSPACKRCSPRCCSRGPANNSFPRKESAHGILRQGLSDTSVSGAHRRIVLPRCLRFLRRCEHVDGRAQPRPPGGPARGLHERGRGILESAGGLEDAATRAVRRRHQLGSCVHRQLRDSGELQRVPGLGHFAPGQADAEGRVVAHNGSLIPIPGRDIMVQAWYQGGISVFDWTDPAHPQEIAYFDRGPMDSTKLVDGGYWSSYWYNGYIFASELSRGLDIFKLKPS